MSKYTDRDIEKARELRRKNRYSFAHLQKLTGIPATTIRNWCNGDNLGTKWDTLLTTNERKRQELKKSEIYVVSSIKPISRNIAKILVSIIYWCEGCKYPSTNKVAFVNSDPDLVKTFLILFRKAYILDESKLRVHLQIHNTHNYNNLSTFWSNLLQIPVSKFIKPTITKIKGGKHRKIYKGTCTIRYADFRVQLKLMGIYKAFAKNLMKVS